MVGAQKGFEERHYHDKPPSAPAEEGNIGMMRLLGVGPIDIISTTIMTTTLNGSLLALAHGSPSSSSPSWGHLMPPRPYRASSFNLGSSTTTLPAPCGAPSASCGRGAGCCALLLAMAMAIATGTPTPTPTPHATPRLLVIRYISGKRESISIGKTRFPGFHSFLD